MSWPSSTISSSSPGSAATRATTPAVTGWPRRPPTSPATASSTWQGERAMTVPTYRGLQTALSGLEAAQAAIDTTGQNIANASTPGYSRQQVNLTERSPLTIPALSSYTGQGSQLGAGVDITSITRIRDTFLDSQYRSQNSQTSADNTNAQILGQAQASLNEPTSSGLSSVLDTFFQGFNTYSTASNQTGRRRRSSATAKLSPTA